MKKMMMAGLFFAATTVTASANELEKACEAYIAENGGDVSGCSCLAENADDGVTAELLAAESQDDIDAASDATKAVLAICFPPEPQPTGS